MILAALFSGGKDSTFSIYKAQKLGHQIKCLVTVFPKSDESHLLHYSNIELSELQSKSLGIPHLTIKANSYYTEVELDKLEEVLESAKIKFDIDNLRVYERHHHLPQCYFVPWKLFSKSS